MTIVPWAGQLALAPGARHDAVRLERPDVAARLLVGCAATAVVARVGAVFSLCSHVQAITAAQALAVARASVAPNEADGLHRLPLHAVEQTLALATAREHVLRITQDWPAALPAAVGLAPLHRALEAPSTQSSAIPLVACPLWRAGLADAERLPLLGDWLAEHLLGMQPEAWLAAYLDEPQAWPDQWCGAGLVAQGPLAKALVAVAPRAKALALMDSGASLHWPAGEAEAGQAAQQLARTLAGDLAFARQPTWHGRACDTGPWQRTHGPATTPAASARRAAAAAGTVWGRLFSRLADLVWLACSTPPGATACAIATPRLAHGAVITGPLQGLAWSEMARGLLVHAVQLAESPTGWVVARYQVVAPTDWNGHPQGSLAQSVSRLAAGDAQAARLLSLAYDPCVPVQVKGRLSHAASTGVVHA